MTGKTPEEGADTVVWLAASPEGREVLEPFVQGGDVALLAKFLPQTLEDDFNGTMRLMAVAVSQETMGAVERPVIVRGPFVLSPNAPTTVAPDDDTTPPT